MPGKLKGLLRERARAGENPYQTPNSWVSLSLSTLPVLFARCVCFFSGVCPGPPTTTPDPALTLFCSMERFHGEPLPFSQAVPGQYQCCAPGLGTGQKLALSHGWGACWVLGAHRGFLTYP